MFISSWHGDCLFTSPLAEIAWCCSDLDKRSNFLALCSLAKVIIPIATEISFTEGCLEFLLEGREVGREWLEDAGIHLCRLVLVAHLFLDSSRRMFPVVLCLRTFFLLPRALLFHQQPCCFSCRRQIQIWFIQSSQVYEENGWKPTEHSSVPPPALPI